MAIGIDVGSETHYAGTFDCRGIEFSGKLYKFSGQGTEISTVENSASLKGAETKLNKGTVKNVCSLCA